MPVQSLHSIAHSILLSNKAVIRDVGFSPYNLIRDLLFGMKAAQMRIVEANSPHLHPESEEVWKHLCSSFINIRIAIEDGKMIDPPSWRELYGEEELLAAEKLEGARNKLRSKAEQFKAEKRTVIAVDGVQALKKRKITSNNYKPKTMMEKARSKGREVSRIYAPRRPSAGTYPLPSRIIAALSSPAPSSSTSTPPSARVVRKSQPVITIRAIKTVKEASPIPLAPTPAPLAPINRPVLALPASRPMMKKPSSSLFMPKKTIKR